MKKFITDVNLSNNRIRNLSNPIDQLDGISKDYLDDNNVDHFDIYNYNYSSTTTTPPASGEVRLNNLIFSSVTELYIHITDLLNFDSTDTLINLFQNQRIKIQQQTDKSKFVIYEITNTTDNTSYYTLNLTYIKESNSGPSQNSDCIVIFENLFTFTGTSNTENLNSGIVRDDGTESTGTRLLLDNGNWSEFKDISAGKQDLLISGENIKTLNGNSLLGDGNLELISWDSWTQGNILIAGSSSIDDSTYKFDDSGVTNKDVWSADKIIDYIGEPHNNAGVITEKSDWIDNGDGTITLPDLTVGLYDNANFQGDVNKYEISGGTTGTELSNLVDNATNYVGVIYNSGSPEYIISSFNDISYSDEIRYLTIYRMGNFLHILEYGEQGAGLPNKLNKRLISINKFARESGFALGLSGSTGIVTLSGGVAWNGTYQQSLPALNSSDNTFFKNYKVSGEWTVSTTQSTINNQYYNDGTDLVTASASSYLVNWYYRGQEMSSHLYEVYGEDQYESIASAQLSNEPGIPDLIASHAFLVGRIIIEVGETVGEIESSFVRAFQSSSVIAHNDLNGIQGGSENQHYHLTLDEYDNNAYKNINNNFTTSQTITGDLSVDGNLSLTFSSGLITDSSGEGLKYTSDYSNTFVTNSLVTKKYVDDNSGGGGGGDNRIISEVTTTNDTPTELEKIISIPNDSTSIIKVYIKSFSSGGSEWGVWERSLSVTRVSGTTTIRKINSDFDSNSSGLKSNSISFEVNTGDIDIDVTGIAATTIDWKSAYEIIL